jgi:group I intron endonuclease
MRYTGIYKITNLKNDKFYIGQSRDIFTRWKTHTKSLSEQSYESVIRMAFAKYGLKEQVSKPGVYGNFRFEIVEISEEDNLLLREAFYIKSLKPAYNIQLLGTNPIFFKNDKLKSKHFVQYHSLAKMGYFPGYDEEVMVENLNYGIFTKKRMAVNMLGASVGLILGGRPEGEEYNHYYLWSEMTVEDIQYDEDNKTYVVQGIENLLKQPIDIINIDGFINFKKRCGNFAYGLQGMESNDFYMNTLFPMFKENKIMISCSYKEWLDKFIAGEEEKYKK